MFVMKYAFDELYVSIGQNFEIFIMLQKCESSKVVTHEFALFFSTIAKNFSCGEAKTGYLVKFGIAPYVKDELIESVSNEPYVILFDESLNKAIKSKQLDIHIRFWNKTHHKVESYYFTSQFLGQAKATDLLQAFKKSMLKLDRSNLFSIGMDGPNVNFKFVELFNAEQESIYNKKVLMIGSCGLHTVHNSFKAGFITEWDVSTFLRALHNVFDNVPARRQGYTDVTKSAVFPLPFCNHRWLENLPVAQRAIEIFDSVKLFIKSVDKKLVTNPGTHSYDTVVKCYKDIMLKSKLLFYISIAELFTPFLTKYQTDKASIPFLGQDLHALIQSIYRRFICDDICNRPLDTICDIDLKDKALILHHTKVDIGVRTDMVFTELKQKGRISDRGAMEFRKECINILTVMCKKLIAKSPLKYPLVQALSCLNPKVMFSHPNDCRKNMKSVLQIMEHANVLRESPDIIMQEYHTLIDAVMQDHTFGSFSCALDVDTFLYEKVHEKYPTVWRVMKQLLLLSHGQATVEKGFSINKEVERPNIEAEAMEAERLICDTYHKNGNLPITEKLLKSVSSARKRYRDHLDMKKAEKQREAAAQKRKASSAELDMLCEKKQCISVMCENISQECDRLAFESEGKNPMKMAELITKSNALRKRLDEKKKELKDLDDSIKALKNI